MITGMIAGFSAPVFPFSKCPPLNWTSPVQLKFQTLNPSLVLKHGLNLDTYYIWQWFSLKWPL
jgi:hypothetical protein